MYQGMFKRYVHASPNFQAWASPLEGDWSGRVECYSGDSAGVTPMMLFRMVI